MEPQNQEKEPNQTTHIQNFDQMFDKIWDSFKEIHQQYDIQYTSQSKSKIKQYLNKDTVNYSLGAMYGAFMGDALGSYLEFNHNISEISISKAMEMPGGGTFQFIQPGQFTDDSEMASHLLTALITYDPSKDLYQQDKSLIVNIAKQYLAWFRSGPFDIGITTRIALGQIFHLFQNHKLNRGSPKDISEFYKNLMDTFKTISNKNEKSQSNGSLMRITPMAFFVSTLMKNSKNAEQRSFSHYEDFIDDEVNMTHGNEAIFQSSKSWVNLLVQMIMRQGKSIDDVYQNFDKKYTENGQRNYKNVQEWIKNSKEQAMDAVSSMGWAKIAFTHGLRQVRELIGKEKSKDDFMNAKTYKKIMRDILKLEGDTDTNAAIIGGLVGAVLGFKNLPYEYLEKQFNLRLVLDEDEQGSRGTEYEPRRQFLKAISLLQKFQKGNKQDKK